MSVTRCRFNGFSVSVTRLDQADALGTGNKYFKLKYNLQRARDEGYHQLLSFGGAYSNHIHALALAGQQWGMATVGVIRGEAVQPLNPTLADAQAAGMQLHFVSRQQYRDKHQALFKQALQQQFPDSYWLPEGGSNVLGVRGCMDIAGLIDPEAELIVLPCGTAATLAGVAAACPDRQVLGVSVLKNAHDLEERVQGYLTQLCDAGYIDAIPNNWSINHDYHCGGYAKVSPELAAFINDFEQQTQIPLEPVYSGKMFYAVNQLLKTGGIDTATPLAAIHTGGLQGLRGMRSTIRQRLAASPMQQHH